VRLARAAYPQEANHLEAGSPDVPEAMISSTGAGVSTELTGGTSEDPSEKSDDPSDQRPRGLPDKKHRGPSDKTRKGAFGVATAVLWAGAATSWVLLYRLLDPQKTLGWDLLTTWRAEKAFAHGGEPYAVKAFVYPPSCLIVLRPLAGLTRHELTVGGLLATAVIACAAVMIAAVAIGARWWGPTAAATVLLLSFTGAMRGEMSLENTSVLGFLALAVFFFFALRDHWYVAAVAIGLSISIKPLLVVVLLVFLLARRWKAFGLAVAIPVVLNALAIALVSAPLQVLNKLPSLLNRTGSGVTYNSAWVDVARSFGLPEGATILLRIATVVLALVAAWFAWTRLADPRLRIITATSALLAGEFLSGTLSEYHFMLTLVPLGMTVVIRGSVIRTVTGVIGIAWVMDALAPPPALLGLGRNANDSAFRAIGMSLLILTVTFVLARRGPLREDSDPRHALTRPVDRHRPGELVGQL
jgi:arabinofuranan 3-O-arabinosyltransferase